MNRRGRTVWARPGLEHLETRTLPAGHTLATATVLSFEPQQTVQVNDRLTAQPDWYRLDLTQDGMLSVDLLPHAGTAVGLRLTLARANGQVLVTSEGTASNPLAGRIDQHLRAGLYYLMVSAQQSGVDYHLQTRFTEALSPVEPLDTGKDPSAVVSGDVNGDGWLDLVTADREDGTLSLFLANGDGTYRPRRTFQVGDEPTSVLLADVDGDGWLDLVCTNGGPTFREGKIHYEPDTLSILLGNGDGTFERQGDILVGDKPTSVAVADVNGDGRLDLFCANGDVNSTAHTLSVLLGRGDGTFAPRTDIEVGFEARSLVVADVTGDGHADLVCAIFQHKTISVLPGRGDGTFDASRDITVDSTPTALVVADINRDGRADILSANRLGNTVSILLAEPEGSFRVLSPFTVGNAPTSLAVADVDGDGRLDLVCAHAEDTLQVFLGNGDGSFDSGRDVPVRADQTSVLLIDVNQDGRPDIVCATGKSNQLTILPGNGDGTFQSRGAFVVGRGPGSVAVGDLNADGLLDVVTANLEVDTLSVMLGNGDGSFQPRRDFAVGSRPTGVALADFNGDGRLDMVSSNRNANRPNGTLSVWLGQGDGSFRTLAVRDYEVGTEPQDVAAADVNGDGHVDLVSANSTSDNLSILLGNGDGTFRDRNDPTVGDRPFAVAIVDVNADGRADLVSANWGDNTLSVLLGQAGGTFEPRLDIPVGAAPVAVAIADLDGDGLRDLVSANLGDKGTLTVLWGGPDPGTAGGVSFKRMDLDLTVEGTPYGVVIADIDGDGRLDLVSADKSDGTFSVLLAEGSREFAKEQLILPAGDGPYALAVGDINGDGQLDLLSANNPSTTLGVHLGPFTEVQSSVSSNLVGEGLIDHTPELTFLNPDGLLDSVILDGSGNILFRPGQVGALSFGAPRILNPDRPARDIVPVRTGTGWAIAAIDARPERGAYTISLYTIDTLGQVHRQEALSLSLLPTRLTAGDLTGTQRDSLIVTHSTDASVTIAFPGLDAGLFADSIRRPVGVKPSDVALDDLDGDGRLDLLISSSISGDVTILKNDAAHSFASETRFRAGLGPYTLDRAGNISSLQHPVDLVVGDFIRGGSRELAILLQGSNELAVLTYNGRGGLIAPQSDHITSMTQSQSIRPALGPIVAGDFDGDLLADLAVLERDRGEVWIFLNQGDGTFRFTGEPFRAGDSPRGLTLFPNPDTKQLDLLVGSAFGDILQLAGKGDGSFSPLPFTGTRTTLSVLSGVTGRARVLVANQQANRVTMQRVSRHGRANRIAALDSGDAVGLQAPGNVNWLKLDGPRDRFADAVVVDTGNNRILFYRDLEKPGPLVQPVSYFVGTHPVSLTVADLNGDGVADMLVTNQGSNDVSVLFGELEHDTWRAIPGPRLSSGGIAPISTTLRDISRDGRPDLVVTNRIAAANSAVGSLSILPARGQGFFDDRTPSIIALPDRPGAPPTPTPGGPIVIPGQSGGLMGFDLTTLRVQQNLLSTNGLVNAVAAVGNRLVVAMAGGSVLLLQGNEDDLFEITAELQNLTGLLPSEPSALAVLENGSGLLVLLTATGSDQLFVFGPSSATADFPLTQQVPTAPVVFAATEVEGAPLAVVVTLLAGVVPEGDTTVPVAPQDIRVAAFQQGGDNEQEQEAPEQEQGKEAIEEAEAAEEIDPTEAAEKLLRARPREEDPYLVVPPPAKEEADEDLEEQDPFAAAMRLLTDEQMDIPMSGEENAEVIFETEELARLAEWEREWVNGVLVSLAVLELSWRTGRRFERMAERRVKMAKHSLCPVWKKR